HPVNEESPLITILFLLDKFDKRNDFISPNTNSPLRAFKKLSIDPLFPKSIYNDAQMFALTEHAEKEGLLEVIEFSDTNRNKKIKYQLTEKALALIPLELTHFTKRIEN
ncbi:hypothetical protein, partial [Legionella sp.]|uniref:hypothetical protein n=1 Tax=Legionella sp. TaxID=459 RepID=UPI003D10AF7B